MFKLLLDSFILYNILLQLISGVGLITNCIDYHILIWVHCMHIVSLSCSPACRVPWSHRDVCTYVWVSDGIRKPFIKYTITRPHSSHLKRITSYTFFQWIQQRDSSYINQFKLVDTHNIHFIVNLMNVWIRYNPYALICIRCILFIWDEGYMFIAETKLYFEIPNLNLLLHLHNLANDVSFRLPVFTGFNPLTCL